MRLFCPSYQIPGTWAENAEYIAADPRLAEINGIELLLFRYNDEDRELFLRDIPRLRLLAERFSYSIHLPDTLRAEHRRLFEDAAELGGGESLLDGAVMHLPPAADGDRRTEALGLRERFSREFGVEICLENTRESPPATLPDGVGICLDTGHALLGGEDPQEHLARFGKRIRALHLHGIAGGRDHAALDPDQKWFTSIRKELTLFPGRLVLELFDLDKLVGSLRALLDVGISPEDEGGER